MDHATGSTTGADTPMSRQAKLEWLGLPADATDSDVTRLQEQLEEYLGEAPLLLQPWARRQAIAASAPVVSEAASSPDSQAGAAETSLGTSATTADAEHADAELPSGHVDDDVTPGPETSAAAPVQYTGRRKQSPTTVLLILALAVSVVIGVYFMGGGGTADTQAAGKGAPAAAQQGGDAPQQAPTPVPLDTAKVDELTAKLEKSPKDTVAMRDLANTYFQSGQFDDAAVWQAKVLELEPQNADARLALGAAKFNSGDIAAAEKEWRQVLADEPTNAEAHYNLGFMFLSKNPPDIEGAKAEWAKVSELAPDSELAKTAKAHLDRLSQMPAPSPAASSPEASTPAPSTPAPTQQAGD